MLAGPGRLKNPVSQGGPGLPPAPTGTIDSVTGNFYIGETLTVDGQLLNGAIVGWVALFIAGAQQGSRVSVTYNAGLGTYTANLTVSSIASYTIQLYDASTGGTLYSTFGPFSVTAIPAPTDIQLSATSVAESASIGSTIANITATSFLTATFSEVADPDGKFTVSGTQLNLAASLDHETATSHSVTIRATSSAGTYDETFAITVVDVVELPVNTVAPSISGTARQGQTLTGNKGTWTSAAGTITYLEEWLRNGSTLVGTGATYTCVSGDVGQTLTYRVTATNNDGSAQATAVTGTVAALAPPTNSVAPSVSGSTSAGSTLTGSNGTWSSSVGTISYSYEWLENSTLIPGANASTYATNSGDVGSTFEFRVTATNVDGSTTVTSSPFGPMIASSAYDPDAVILFAAMTVQPDSTRKGLYNDLIEDLKSDGIWSQLDALYILAAHDSQAALLNVKAPGTFNATLATGTTFTTDRGYLSTGGHIDTNFNPATAGGQFIQDSGHVMVYVNAATSDGLQTVAALGKTGGVDVFIRPRTTGSSFEGRVNSGTNQAFGTVSTRLGGRIVSRTASNDTRGFVDGVQLGIPNTIPSASPVSATIVLLKLATGADSVDTVGAASIGGGLSVTDAGALHTRVFTFLAAIGAS